MEWEERAEREELEVKVPERKERGKDSVVDRSGEMFNRMLKSAPGDKEGKDLDFMRKCLYMQIDKQGVGVISN